MPRVLIMAGLALAGVALVAAVLVPHLPSLTVAALVGAAALFRLRVLHLADVVPLRDELTATALGWRVYARTVGEAVVAASLLAAGATFAPGPATPMETLQQAALLLAFAALFGFGPSERIRRRLTAQRPAAESRSTAYATRDADAPSLTTRFAVTALRVFVAALALGLPGLLPEGQNAPATAGAPDPAQAESEFRLVVDDLNHAHRRVSETRRALTQAGLFVPRDLETREDLDQRRRQLGELAMTVKQLRYQVNQLEPAADAVLRATPSGGAAESVRRALTRGEDLLAYCDRQEQQVAVAYEVVQFLEDRLDHWRLRDGRILFEEPADQAAFSALVARAQETD